MVTEKGRHDGRLRRATRTLLFLDVVEYTRLLNNNERDTILRWRRFVERIESKILPALNGRIVHSLGDGLLLDFASVSAGARAVTALQETIGAINQGYPAEQHFLLRMGMEVSNVEIDAHDVYGRGALLGARLMTMAGPGECVVSSSIRRQLKPELTKDIADLGDCYLKHLSQPVRAFRLGPPGPRPVVDPSGFSGRLVPAIAVVPFEARNADLDHLILGDVLAEEVIRAVSQSQGLDVISRLSTRVFRDREWTPSQLRVQLDVDYILSGVYQVQQNQLVLDVELVETRSGYVVWTQRLKHDIGGILKGEQQFIGQIAADLNRSITARELRRTRTQALPNIESYALLMSGVNLMHSKSLEDFLLAQKMLMTVSGRATRQSAPRAWLAKWYVMRKHQGWSVDAEDDSRNAMKFCREALDADPTSSLALAIDGLVQTHVQRDLDAGYERYSTAVESNPNDPMAWLLKGALHAFRDEGQIAVSSTQRALSLSPLDPHRYYFESLAATAFLAARQYELALEYAKHSLRMNPAHTSTLRAKLIAEWYLGFEGNARRTALGLLRLEPKFTVAAWQRGSPSESYRTGAEWTEALKKAGLPG